MMTLRQQRRMQRKLQSQLASQIEQERNGAPIPRDIASRMSTSKVVQPLFQVKADVKDRVGRVERLPIGPKWGFDAAEQLLIAVNAQLSLGKLPGWSNTAIEPAYSNA